MKTKKIIGGIVAIALMAFASIVMPNLLPRNNPAKGGINKLANIERESYNDAAKYIFGLRVNPATGRIDVSEVEAARQQVAAMTHANQTARTQSGSNDLNWQELGPDNIGGRTRAILVSRTHPDSMFAGSVSGGLWRSTDHGLSWYKYCDSLQSLSVSCITQAANGDIYFGTGSTFEGISGNGASGFFGEGVWKSTDGGATFSRLASTWSSASVQQTWEVVNSICADPNLPNRVYAATEQGLRVSNDGGNSWTNPVLLNGNPFTETGQSVKVGSDGTVVCALNGLVYIDTTGTGTSFVRISAVSIPNGRVEVAISPSNPKVIYVCGINGSSLYNVYRTTDKFQSYTIIGPGNGSFDPFCDAADCQGYYDCAIGVAPDNQDKIFVVGIESWKWQIDSGWTHLPYIHSDMHTVVFNPANAADFFIGTDGGIYETDDQGLSFAERNTFYSVTQFYSCAATYLQGTELVIGGTQDNGTLALTGTGNNPNDAFGVLGGDGFYTSASYYNPYAFFAEIYNAGLGRSSNGAGGGAGFFDGNIDPMNLAGTSYNFAPFNTPYLLWENMNANTKMDTSFFIGLNGAAWMTKSALNFSVTPKWYEIATYSSSNPTCMASTNDGNTLFLGTEYPNEVYRISNLNYVNNNLDNSGTNYNLTTLVTPITKTTLSLPTGSNQVPTSISVDPQNNNHVVITLGNYGSPYGGNIPIHVIQSQNALAALPTWTNITPIPSNSTFPIDMPVYSSIIDRWNPDIIMVGTELGVFVTDDGGGTWTYQDQMPRVPCFMIKQISQYTNGLPAEDIYVASHGRGIWKTSTLTGINDINGNNKLQVSIYPNPTADVANINFNLNKSMNVLLDIFNVEGQKVKSLNIGTQASGAHVYSMDLTGMASGTYIMNATLGDEKSISKFVIAR